MKKLFFILVLLVCVNCYAGNPVFKDLGNGRTEKKVIDEIGTAGEKGYQYSEKTEVLSYNEARRDLMNQIITIQNQIDVLTASLTDKQNSLTAIEAAQAGA